MEQKIKSSSSTACNRGSACSSSTNDGAFFGNKRNRTKTTHFNDLDLKAIPFTEEPQQALESFHEWCSSHGILFRGDTKIEAQYLPFWTFDINVRYTTLAANGYNTTTNVRPAPFDSAYKNKNNKNNTIHLQGISAYAGYNYRRKLVNPVHSSTVLFLGNDKIQEFLGWMLDPLPYLHTGMEVNLDTWNASKGRAFAVVVEDLRNLAMDDAQFLKKIKDFDVDVEVLNAQRVYMPTFVITYSIFGVEYRAFVSGCDPNTTVSGISHSAFASSTSETIDTATGIVARGAHSLFRHVTQVVGFSYALNSLHRPMLWLTKSILGVVSRFPIVTAAAGGFALYRKFMRPYLEHVVSKDEWEKQREREAGGMQDDYAWSHRNSFRDDGSAKAYFERNREAILRHLSGEGSADQPKSNFYTFYQQFEEYQRAAERQGREEYNAYREQEWFEEQTRGFYSEYGEKNKSQVKKKRTKQQQATTNVSMEQDPYDLLGVKRGATKEEVSRAFRKEMMRYHPDALPFASEEEKRRSTERSKQITEAYREIKNSMRGK
eukprot:CAMPEP_0116009610 /NCGR_PEP_ID=MMETSP0321-20121206/3529_1 /TAXON_ID=163516 /ORGANISM="Leptocylindrus danicus var. danicus, Strain B650" /LENGTH=545 /DNA_ID=CAMNT_0003478593 /DNA_START=165 /DNA_END=1803 /DNA_ORIENTATION=+